MTIEDRIKSMLGEQQFMIASMQTVIEQRDAEIAELKTNARIKDLEKPPEPPE